MWKKNRILQAALILCTAMCVCGCGAKEKADSPGSENVSDGTQGTENGVSGNEGQEGSSGGAGLTQEDGGDGYYYVVGGVTIGTDMDMDALLPKLGEIKSVFEAPSCAGEGISYIYNFSAFEIETYPAADGKNRIGYITLKDDMTATAEGIDLSMTREDVVRVYGEDYEESGDGISYVKNGTKLSFIFDGNNITSIEYVSTVIG